MVFEYAGSHMLILGAFPVIDLWPIAIAIPCEPKVPLFPDAMHPLQLPYLNLGSAPLKSLMT